MNMTRRVLAVLVLVSLGAFGLAGCAASSGGGSVQNAGQAPAQDVPAEADPGEPDTAVVITGRISIVAEDPIDAAGAATVIVTDAGGRVSARTEHAAEDGSQASADLTLRVPADALEDVRSGLASLGTVKETTLDSAEVGGTQRDLDARITTLRASIARYNEWLGTASATSDLIELESAIAERQTELEGLEAQAHALDDQVAMSTITLSLMSEYVPVKTAPDDFGEALLVGWNGFVAFWSAVLIAVGVALPWLVLFAAIAVGATLLTIRARRRQSMRLQPPQPVLDAALFPAPEQMPAPEQVTGPR